MANANIGDARLSNDELARAAEEARIRKQQRIEEAIKNGAKIIYINCSLSLEERETLINISEIDNIVTVDTSIQKDITKFINKGWKITSITYRKSAININDRLMGIAAMTFEGPINKISIRDCSSLQRNN